MANKSERLSNRATRVMGRAQKNWKKGTDALNYDETKNPGTSNAVAYASQKLNKSARQEERAESLMARSKAAAEKESARKAAKSAPASTMKKGGSVTAKKMVTKKKK
jgi:hypothetical protein